MGFTDSFKKVIGLSEISDDEIVTEEELQVEKKRIEKETGAMQYQSNFSPANRNAHSYGAAARNNSAPRPAEKRFSVTGSNSLKLILIEPTGFDECPKLVDSLKSRKPIIINLEKL